MKGNVGKNKKQTSKKVTNNVLTPEQREELKEMVLNKVRPAAIAEHFGVAISTVHYQKGLLKNDGVKIPSVRGREQLKKTEKHTAQLNYKKIKQASHQHLIINGTAVHVAEGTSIRIAGAKSVNIGSNGELEITF